MYLGSALKIAIPYAILDREDFARVHGFQGAEAQEAKRVCDEVRALSNMKVRQFKAEQRETARLTLCWAEQYLLGYLVALAGSDKAEVSLVNKQLKQIRKVRLSYFGATANETAIARCIEVPIGGINAYEDILKLLKNVVVCSRCNTKTNGRVVGDICNSCNVGIFQKA